MKTLAFTFLLCLVVTGSQAQSTGKTSWLQTGFTAFFPIEGKNVTEIISVQNDFRTTRIYTNASNIYLGIGLMKVREDSWYWTYQITGFAFQVRDDVFIEEVTGQGFPEPVAGNRVDQAAVHTRIEFGKLFRRDQKNKVFPSLGLSLDPYYEYLRIIPKTSAGYPRKLQQLGLTFRVIPGIAFQLAPRFQLTIKAPVGLNNFELAMHRTDNPVATDKERRFNQTKNQLGWYDLQTALGINIQL